jgi:hypothetical protein
MAFSTLSFWIDNGALEDSDDGDDTATGNFDWVLSIRDKPHCVV